jgi:hypothetical protein
MMEVFENNVAGRMGGAHGAHLRNVLMVLFLGVPIRNAPRYCI